LLAHSRYTDDRALGRWPMERAAIEQTQTITVVRDQDLLWRFEDGQLLVGLLCSTEHLTAGKLLLPPGHRSGRLCHPGDKSLYLTQGTLHVFCPDKPDAPNWFELHEQDGFFLPAGSCHEFHNLTGQPVECLFGVAPTYC
jgi:quercetin dioxygenase-like cupin family protein